MDIKQTQAKLALSASHGVSVAQDALDAINVLVNDAEQMRIRMGEMAAEIDRLNGEREQLRAQGEPIYQAQFVGYLWLDVDEDTFDHLHENRRKLYPQAVPAQQAWQ